MLLLQLFVLQPNAQGGFTLGHPYGTQSLELTLEGGLHPIKKEC